MSPRSTWTSFLLTSATILLAAGWLGATVWEQDAREQRSGIEALWEQKVQAALWRMDAAASAMVAREANRRPEEIAALARQENKSWNLERRDRANAGTKETKRDAGAMHSAIGGGRPLADASKPADVLGAAEAPAAPAAAPAPAPAASSMVAAKPPAAAPAQMRGGEENKSRYFSGKVAAKKAGEAEQEKSVATRTAFAKAAAPQRAAPATADESLAAELADKLPAPKTEIADGKVQARYREFPNNRIDAQVEAQVTNSYTLRQAAKDSIAGNSRDAGNSFSSGGRREAPAGALVPLAEDGELVLARRVGTPGHETVQGVRLSTADVAEELLALVRADFPRAQLIPEYATPPRNLARTLAALPLRFEPNERPRLVTDWTPTRSAVTAAGCALLVALGAVALLLARTLALSERRAAFVSTMTHELRTPLTTFRLYTDLLEAAPETADRARYTQVLAREAERLSHLVENVLSYARLERGRAKPVPKAQTVDALLSPAIDRLRERAERAGFTLEVAPHDGAQLVKADAATVEQILLNLVDNAGKYAVAAADKRLVLSVAQDAIRLRDFGPGLDPIMRKRLFTPFSRSDKEAAGNAPGVGLGLALCRRLAREMGGDLVYREADPGAEFALVLAK